MDILTDTNVTDVDRADAMRLTVRSGKGEQQLSRADQIIFAVGRAGSRFFSGWCSRKRHPAGKQPGGRRRSRRAARDGLGGLLQEIYEPKIWYRSKQYGDVTRMFCFNERGQVVTENTDGVLTVNGHSYRDESRKTQNSNFALLSTIRFTQPFKEPIEYARHVASLANLISGGSVLVQRLGDLENGRRTDEKRLASPPPAPPCAPCPAI